jgi:hypothetical protein
MAHLTPSQQQALMGAWYTIVGRGAHGRAAFRGRRRFRQPWDGYGYDGGYGELEAEEEYAPYPYPYPAYPAAPYPAAYPAAPYPAAPYPVAPAAPQADAAAAPTPASASAAASGVYGGHYAIPPRNALVQDPGPDRAGREVLPMSTGVAILPTQSAQITARPQRVAFRPERVFISAAGTSGGAADWVVNDIKIGNRSQFSQSGDVPGDMFATNAIDGFVSFETAQTAMDVVMVVTYIGLNESGVPFFASIVGTAAI